MKTREKNKDTGGKIKTGGKNIIYFPPVEILKMILIQKKIEFSGKNMI